jgi:hypothetical protein
MYLQRNIRIQLDAIQQMNTRCYIKNQAVWKLGTIIQKFGKLHYQVKLDDYYIFKRH